MDMQGKDVGNRPFALRKSRLRTWLRGHTPDLLYYRLGLAVPKARNCGDHEWYNRAQGTDACYHCEVTRPTPADSAWSDNAPPAG